MSISRGDDNCVAMDNFVKLRKRERENVGNVKSLNLGTASVCKKMHLTLCCQLLQKPSVSVSALCSAPHLKIKSGAASPCLAAPPNGGGVFMLPHSVYN